MQSEQRVSISTLIIVSILVSMITSGLTVWYIQHYASSSQPVSVASSRLIAEESETVSAVSKAMPGVVSIIVSKNIGQEFQEVGGGSGFIVRTDGLIVTNKHVVADETAQYKVVFNNGTFKEAKVVARDPISDIALVKVDSSGLSQLTFDTSSLVIGQTVIAIGNALGEFQNSVTKGVISGINRRVLARDGFQNDVIEGAIQTDAAINQGNSGGPLVNLAGQVVGINTAVSRQGQLIGFAIPSLVIQTAVESYKKTGHIVRPWLGVRYLLNPDGALISSNGSSSGIIHGSPAEKAGLKEKDLITEVNGTPITEQHSLSAQLSTKNVGDTVKLTILREGISHHITVTLGELPAESQK